MVIKVKGYIALYRELCDKPIWIESTPVQKVILIVLLLTVNHAPRKWWWKGRPFLCQPGQKVTSVNGIQKLCGKGVTRQNIRTALKRFEKFEFLTKQVTKQGMLITVCNWDSYQKASEAANPQLTKADEGLIKSEQDSNQQPNQDKTGTSTGTKEICGTQKEKPTNELTDSQPTANLQLTTNKKGKNGNNNISPVDFVNYWNSSNSLPKIKEFTGSRKRQLCTRAREQVFYENWRLIIDKLRASPFHIGQNDRGWRANVDWLLKNDGNYVKIFERTDRDEERSTAPLQRDVDGFTPREKFKAQLEENQGNGAKQVGQIVEYRG